MIIAWNNPQWCCRLMCDLPTSLRCELLLLLWRHQFATVCTCVLRSCLLFCTPIKFDTTYNTNIDCRQSECKQADLSYWNPNHRRQRGSYQANVHRSNSHRSSGTPFFIGVITRVMSSLKYLQYLQLALATSWPLAKHTFRISFAFC